MKQLICTATLLAALSACSDSPSDAPPPPPKAPQAAPAASDEALMQAVFGQRYLPQKKWAVAEFADEQGKENYVVTALSHTALPNGEVLLATNSEIADAQGGPGAGHAEAGRVSVYGLRWQDGAWRVSRRHENFDGLGSSGQSGEAKWLKLGRDGAGLAMMGGGTWQGYTLVSLALYDLSGGKVRSLTGQSIDIHSDSNGACGPTTEECWEISADWAVQAAAPQQEYGDLVLTFSGKEDYLAKKEGEESVDPEAAEEAEPARVGKKVEGAARYRFVEGQYKLVEGKNLVKQF